MSSALIIVLFAQMSAVTLLIPLVVSWSTVSYWGKSYLLAPWQKAFCQPYINSGGNFKFLTVRAVKELSCDSKKPSVVLV